jgi:MYXO-CTERM domain-containing protein
MCRRRRAALAVSTIWLALAYGSSAHAFCRTTTCETCEAPPNGCVTDGVPLYWPDTCISYSLQRDASDVADLQTATDAADLAFTAWESALCPTTGKTPYFKLQRTEPVACGKHEYNDQEASYGGNANIIVFRDTEWTATKDPHTLALTTVTYNKSTGEIFDAVIEVNSHVQFAGMQGISTATPVPSSKFDLQSILTHEAGHFLGLAHSDVDCSSPDHCPTMDAAYQTGTSDFRDLEPDDVAGICAIYPRDRAVSGDETCSPRHGFSGECGVPGEKGCCATAPGGPSSRGSEGLFAALAGLALWVARRRPAERS